MTRIYCSQCFSIPQLMPYTGQGSLNHIAEFICRGHDLVPRAVQQYDLMNRPSGSGFLYGNHHIPVSLREWIDAASIPERPARAVAADRLHANGAVTANSEGTLFINGPVDFSGLDQLTELPPKMSINGDLNLTGCILLHSLPEGTYIAGLLIMPDNHYGNDGAQSAENNVPFIDDDFDDSALRGLIQASENRNRYIETESGPVPVSIYDDADAESDMSVEYDLSQVITKPGRELEDVLEALNDNPQAGLFVIYENNKAFDNGAVSRQALTAAFQQILGTQLLYQTANGQFTLKLDIAGYTDIRRLLDESHSLGLILGAMMAAKVATGHAFVPEINRFIYDAHRFLNYMLTLNPSKNMADYILELAEGTDRARSIGLIQDVMKSRLHQQVQLDYLSGLSLNDLKEYTTEAAVYLNIANEMRETGLMIPEDFDSFCHAFAGPVDIRQFILSNLEYYNPGDSLPPEHMLSQKLVEWFARAVTESSDDEIKKLNLDLFGASSATAREPFYLAFSAFNNSNTLFNSHACARSLDVNEELFSTLVHNDQYKLFKMDLLQGSSDIFNGS